MKTKDYKQLAIVLTILGIIFFLTFAYDMVYQRGFWMYMWLLNSIISFMSSLRFFIVHDILKNKEEDDKNN